MMTTTDKASLSSFIYAGNVRSSRNRGETQLSVSVEYSPLQAQMSKEDSAENTTSPTYDVLLLKGGVPGLYMPLRLRGHTHAAPWTLGGSSCQYDFPTGVLQRSR
jgi:hypothetical protein